MYFDSHVHCRDEEEFSKEIIKHVLETAEMAGVDGIIDIVNTQNPLINRKRVEERLNLAAKINSNVFYAVYMNLTSNSNQIKDAVKIYKELFPFVAGLKLFAGKSVGNLSVAKKEEQEKIYYILREEEYKGVLMVHCEEEKLFKNRFNPKKPISHNLARPPESELSSIIQQVELSYVHKFLGNLHFAHVSTPEAIEYIIKIKENLRYHEMHNLKVSCEASPHHLFCYDELMEQENGILLKVNPPLRSKKSQKKLLEHLIKGDIDFIASDHAPHELNKKLNEPYYSGIPEIDMWPKIANKLKKLDISNKMIEDLTFNNSVNLFGLNEYVEKTNNSGDLSLNEYKELRPRKFY